MGVIKLTRKYNCYNDCSMAGCPGHAMSLEFNTVTDSVTVDNGKGSRMLFEPPEADAFVEMLKELSEIRADAPVKFLARDQGEGEKK